MMALTSTVAFVVAVKWKRPEMASLFTFSMKPVNFTSVTSWMVNGLKHTCSAMPGGSILLFGGLPTHAGPFQPGGSRTALWELVTIL